MNDYAILTDVTRCTGCETCVVACKELNGLPEDDAPWAWQGSATDLSSTRWTTIARTGEGRAVRVHCRHCLEPACAAACPVGALKRTGTGAVAYDPEICMGCRYCLVACPFGMTRYEWESATPRVRKCILCFEKLQAGEIEQPACTATCPEDATVFGRRDAMLAEARRRIVAAPDRYIQHIWGEHEVGGTSVLYISDIELTHAGWPANLPEHGVPHLADATLKTVPVTFLGVGAAMFGLHWVIKRRQQRAVELAAALPAAENAANSALEPASTTGEDLSQYPDGSEEPK